MPERVCSVAGHAMGEVADKPFRIQLEDISQETSRIAARELGETLERVREAALRLRQLLRDNNKLYFRDDDQFLMIFLRPTKFYPESALALMQRVADFKEKHCALLCHLTTRSEESTLLDNRVVNVLKDRDQKGRRILVASVGGAWDTKLVLPENMFRVFYLVHLAAMLEPETQVRGVVVILDFDCLSMRQVMAMSPAFSMRLLSFIQDAMPLRLKEVHIVKQPFLFNVVWSVFKPFVKEKLRNRLFFHGSRMSSLHKHLDPAYIPEDYGGQLPKITYSSANWYPVLTTLDNHITEWSTFGNVKND